MIYKWENKNKYEVMYIVNTFLNKLWKKSSIKILNAWCWTNWIKKYFPKKCQIIWLDINNPNADINWNLEEKLPIDNDQYDWIYCTAVLEHIKNPLFAMKEFNRILKKWWILYITVPSPWDISAWDDPYHIRPYTINAIKMLWEDSWFEFIDWYYANMTPMFWILKLNKFKKFNMRFKHKFKLINNFNFIKWASNVYLKKI